MNFQTRTKRHFRIKFSVWSTHAAKSAMSAPSLVLVSERPARTHMHLSSRFQLTEGCKGLGTLLPTRATRDSSQASLHNSLLLPCIPEPRTKHFPFHANRFSPCSLPNNLYIHSLCRALAVSGVLATLSQPFPDIPLPHARFQKQSSTIIQKVLATSPFS